MSLDARQSLIALGSVLLFIGAFYLSMTFFDGVDIPGWVGPAIGLTGGVINLVWRFFRRRRRATASGPTK
ncbi:MAG: hypothetical protein V4574_11940 [Pseudomonadota bacterium]